MARIFFLAFNSADPTPLIKKLRAIGHKLIVAEPKYPEFDQVLKQQAQPPEVVLCDLSKQPSHVRETCNYLRGLRSLRDVPFVLYNTKAEDDERTKARVPNPILLRDDSVVDWLAEWAKKSDTAP